MKHAERQIDQTRRRVILGEVIPDAGKVFSVFETQWISKGKAGVPVELPQEGDWKYPSVNHRLFNFISTGPTSRSLPDSREPR